MKTISIALFITICMITSCKKGPYMVGYCELIYENIQKTQSDPVLVKVYKHNPDTSRYSDETTEYLLKTENNLIRLILEDGDVYHLSIPGVRHDSIHQVKLQRYGKYMESVSDYSFMFNNISYGYRQNIVHINL